MLRLMLQSIKSLLVKIMRERNACKQGNHEYYCAQRQGMAGEIFLYKRRLTEEDVKNLAADSQLSPQICPGGEVICRRCHNGFGSTQPSLETLLQGEIHPRNHFPKANQ